jgi:homoserine O-succinyltransferase
MFARRGRSLMLFGQGHPEYDADTLLREYCRDAGRFLRGKRAVRPSAPAHYLSVRTQRAFEAVARRAPDPALMERYNAIAASATPRQAWRGAAVTLFRNWLHHIISHKAAVARAAREADSRALLSARA